MKKYFLVPAFILILFSSYSQNIGIGTSNPTRAKLEVHGAVSATAAIFGGETSGISFQRNWPGIGFNNYFNNGHRYMSNGYAALQVLDPTTGNMGIDLFGNGSANGIVNNQNRVLTIYQSGNLQIGPSASNAALTVSRNPGADATAYLFGTTHHSTFSFGPGENTYIRAGRDNGIVFINDIPGSKISLTGKIGINTSDPVCPLEIRQANNKGLLLVDPNTFHNWELRTSQFGQLLLIRDQYYVGKFETDGEYIQISDRRLKTDIQQLPSLLEKVMQLHPVTYEMNYNNPGHKRNTGFIAQDVRKLFPELVNVMKDTESGYAGIPDLNTINYAGFGVLSIKAIQEQQQIIQAQAAELDELETALNHLLNKNSLSQPKKEKLTGTNKKINTEF